MDNAAVMSPSSRRAWIEMHQQLEQEQTQQVALLAEGVDRNNKARPFIRLFCVALLAEGVDRNVE